MDGADGEDAEAAWELSDRAEKGFVAHGGEDPQKMALFAPAMTIPAYKVTKALQLTMPRPERVLSRQISRSPQMTREETRGTWSVFSKIGSAIGFSPSPSSPVPLTPGEDTDSEAPFVELTEADVENLSKADKDKYKKRAKKKRQQARKDAGSARVDSFYS
ncbi:hypothetical protein PHLGIDRAFT_19051 [Phlebiopsis gigantea 11061_1 CR5-6]|uniref:Uncharacterized protein n=1 Tax=Phlebiopsis gigantea (strain 11061_1 CR5-6) TaxID=745531 RepID=A0A0C3RZX2_PHLG1|nr:hypothetical protein PHLGIDRAFT_19051 [Phlebiopsis gigantea 11061_1 CR5-6]